MYLALGGFVHDVEGYDEFTHEYRTCERIPLPADIGGARRTLMARLDALRGILPDVDASLAPRGTGILVDIGAPKRIAYLGGSPRTYRERQEEACATRAMTPEERRRLGHAVEKLTAYERQLDRPNPWPAALAAIERAEARSVRVMAKVDAINAEMWGQLDDTTGPIPT